MCVCVCVCVYVCVCLCMCACMSVCTCAHTHTHSFKIAYVFTLLVHKEIYSLICFQQLSFALSPPFALFQRREAKDEKLLAHTKVSKDNPKTLKHTLYTKRLHLQAQTCRRHCLLTTKTHSPSFGILKLYTLVSTYPFTHRLVNTYI